jgi:hypothetical protein
VADIVDLGVLRPFQPRSAEGRDWLQPGAEIKTFTPRIARCSYCLSPHHRASKCPMRPRSES